MDLQILEGITAIALLAGLGVALNRAMPGALGKGKSGPEPASSVSTGVQSRQAVYPCQACGVLTHELTRVRERQTGKVLGIYCRPCSEIYRP